MKHFSKKLFQRFDILISLLLLVSLMGCTSLSLFVETTPVEETVVAPSATRTPTQQPPTPTATKVTVTEEADPIDVAGTSIRFYHPWPGEAGEVLQDIASKFSLSNPWDIWVDVAAFGSEALLVEGLQSNLDAGDPPALIALHPYWLSSLGEEFASIDLSGYINHPEWGIESETRADIPQVFLDQFSVEDNLLALPIAPQGTVLFYNQSWAEALGFDLPPADENDFSEQSCAATTANLGDTDEENDFTGGWLMNYEPAVLLSWYYAFGGSLSKDALPQFNNESGQEAFGYLRSLFAPEKNCIWVGRQPEPYLYFANRNAIMYAGTLDQIPLQTAWHEQAGGEDQWTISGFPGPAGEVMLVDGPGLFISEDSPETQLAAWLFAKHLLTPEVQARLVQSLFSLPVRESTMDLLDDFVDAYPQWAAAVDRVDIASPMPISDNWGFARWILQDAIIRLFALEEPQVEEILDQLDETIRELEEDVP